MTDLEKAAAALALTLATLCPSASAQAQTSASPFGFTVDVSLSRKARAKLESMSESVTVSSFYYGERAAKPTRAQIRAAEADGQDPNQIELEGEQVTISGSGGVAQMTGRSVTPKDAAAYGRNPVNVNVNVFSARKSNPDNLLACDLFDDAVAKARARTIAIACKLIAEN